MEGLGYLQASMNTYLPIMIILPLRVMVFKKGRDRIRLPAEGNPTALYALPRREFKADLMLWLVIGLGIGLFYLFYFRAPILTGVKILLGCLSFGLLGGMLSYLDMEKRLMEHLREERSDAALSPKKILSVSRKMLFFVVTVLVLMVTVALLMVFMDINYLLTHKDILGPDIYVGVFKDILFAFVVLLALSLLILGRYSRNLRANIDLQLNMMDEISRGNYDIRVPVISNDEFGLIAARTNDMVDGLKAGNFCEISFGRYVTPEVSEKILKGEVAQEGELRVVSIMFCDLRGYTPFAEKRKPKEVVRFLNEYFAEMEQVVKMHKGIVLQFIGDEIEAVFGAPQDLPEHPVAAVKAALEMRRRLDALNQKRESRGESPISHGIGIHTGEVLAGSVGSADRLAYAMVGDTVNIASRIQSMNKQFSTDILISQETKNLLQRNEFQLSSLGKMTLKGKSKEIEIYRVL
ncbi:adenylate/guanylate cyclase domain-containing protein [Thermodesulfobacteriota bacterium]